MYSAHRVYRRGQKPGNFVKAVEGDLPPDPHEGRELPTTHRVVIYAMVITCSGVLPSAAAAVAANPLRLPWNSSFAPPPLVFLSLSLSPSHKHTLSSSLPPTLSYTPSSCPSTTALYLSNSVDFISSSLAPPSAPSRWQKR